MTISPAVAYSHCYCRCHPCVSWAKGQLRVQLESITSRGNELVGSLPETWGSLTSVSPFIGSMGCCQCIHSLFPRPFNSKHGCVGCCKPKSQGVALTISRHRHVYNLVCAAALVVYHQDEAPLKIGFVSAVVAIGLCGKICSCHRVSILKPRLSMQLKSLSMEQNHLSGALPSSWAGLIQASHASKLGSRCTVGVWQVPSAHDTDWQMHHLLTLSHAIAHISGSVLLSGCLHTMVCVCHSQYILL